MSKAKSPRNACARCRFCHQTDNSEQGACRRYPPTPLMRLDGQTTHTFPIVLSATFSCGEFKAARQPRDS
jgi:hypothetical protein